MTDVQLQLDSIQENKVDWTRFVWIIGGLVGATIIGMTGIYSVLGSDVDRNEVAIQSLRDKLSIVDRIDERTLNIQTNLANLTEDVKQLKIIISK